MTTHEHVLGHGQIRKQRRLLVDDGDSGVPRGRGAAERDLLTVDEQSTGVGAVNAGQDLHERRLAGTVLAHQPVDLAGKQVNRHVDQCAHRSKSLLRVLDRQDRWRGTIGMVLYREYARTLLHMPPDTAPRPVSRHPRAGNLNRSNPPSAHSTLTREASQGSSPAPDALPCRREVNHGQGGR